MARAPKFDPAEAVRRWHSGCYGSIAEIARSLGNVSSAAVGAALNARGIFGSPGGGTGGSHRRLKTTDVARIAALAREGWTRAEVQAEMGLSHVTVGKHWPEDVKRLPRVRIDHANERSAYEQAVIDRAATDRLLEALVAAGVPPLTSLGARP